MHEKDRSMKTLSVSFGGVFILIVSLFILLTTFINQMSLDAIQEVGQIYMTGVSEQISMHYQTTVELRLSQVMAMADADVQREEEDHGELIKWLKTNAAARGYEYLALYSADGNYETVCGEEVEIENSALFLQDLRDGGEKIASGTDAAGKRVILFGVPCSYPMENGSVSAALVGGLSSALIGETLFLDEDETLVFSYIIRKDGSYVIRNGNMYEGSYFDRLYSFSGAKEEEQARRYEAELRNAMETEEDYNAILEGFGARRHLYCKKLPYSDWYLVVVLPFDSIRMIVTNMSHRWMFMVYGVCGIILLALAYVFFQYIRMTRKQVHALDEARREAEHANKAKSEFLSNMSHDIRTPMNAIVGMTTIAAANIDNPEQIKNCLHKITLSSTHLLGLINDVLDMSRIESGKMTLNIDRVCLREAMDSIVSIMQPQVKAKRQKFNVYIRNIYVENVCCDHVRLNQALINLLGNAVKFTPEGGSVFVTLYEEPSPKGEIYVRLHLLVKDTGIGMSAEYQKRIFESFSREDNTRVQRTEGSGLGMAITKYIVDAMGGSIEVESEPGKGSEFHVTLDLEKAQMQERDMTLPPWNILVVDDDEQLCESAVDSLKAMGVRAEWASDAGQAVRMAKERHSRKEGYQIILLDWKLPGTDGIAVAKEMRQFLGNDVLIVLISVYDWSEIEGEARKAGVNGFISKPLFKSTLFYGLQAYADGAVEPDSQGAQKEDGRRLSGKRILLAEDNELNWEIADELLSSLGLKLDWAQNGQACVEKFKESEPGYYGAVLMDIRMPVMNGYEATRAIRALGREDADIPIIAMTADAFSEDAKRCLDCGMNAHIAKPIDVREVVKYLEKYIVS